MLSNDLRALKIWFDQCLLDGCEMTAESALAFSRELDAAIGKAEAMETGGVPADALDDRLAARRRAPVEAGNVVRLFPL